MSAASSPPGLGPEQMPLPTRSAPRNGPTTATRRRPRRPWGSPIRAPSRPPRTRRKRRSARRVRRTDDQAQAAARDWLNEINRINRDARHARPPSTRERAAAREIVVRPSSAFGLEADAARISAANADATCLAAR